MPVSVLERDEGMWRCAPWAVDVAPRCRLRKQGHAWSLGNVRVPHCPRLNTCVSSWTAAPWAIPVPCHMSIEFPDPVARPTALTDRAEPSVTAWVVLIVIVLGLQAVTPQASTPAVAQDTADDAAPTLQEAQRSFYNGDYDNASAVAHVLCTQRPENLDACELRTASLHFQIKRALGDTGHGGNKTTAWNACAACPALGSAFDADTVRGQAFARARLKLHPDDEKMLYFLGKIDLNYVWLQLGTLGRKTGWNEYREARRSLDQVLRMNPRHVRGRVARAWVDYIVGTTVPRGVRWILGGGNKKRGLLAVREVVDNGGGEFFDQAEARFALWDMQMREQEVAGAIATARVLARDFPENRELRKFLTTNNATTLGITPVDRTP